MPLPLLIPLVALAATATTTTVSTGAIVGGALAGVGGTAATGGGLWYFFKKRAKKNSEQPLQDVDEHIAYINATIDKIKSYYPWLISDNTIPTIYSKEMIDLCNALETYYDFHRIVYETHKNNFITLIEAKTAKERNIPSYHLDQVIFVKDTQALLKCFEKYKIQINTRKQALFNGESPYREEMKSIRGYLTAFEKNLNELSELTLRMPLILGGRTWFFSLGYYLSTLAKQYKSKTDECMLIQKIAEHHDYTEQIRFELLQLFIQKLSNQEPDKQIKQLRLALEYSSSMRESISDEARSIAYQIGLKKENDTFETINVRSI